MPILDLDVIMKIYNNLPTVCHRTLVFECPCLFAKQYEHRWSDYIKVMEQFQQVEKEIVR